MSVNNSLIPKQHDRPFISMCGIACAGIRAYDACVLWVEESERLQVGAEVSEEDLQTSA